jgi:hypothetical protein
MPRDTGAVGGAGGRVAKRKNPASSLPLAGFFSVLFYPNN